MLKTNTSHHLALSSPNSWLPVGRDSVLRQGRSQSRSFSPPPPRLTILALAPHGLHPCSLLPHSTTIAHWFARSHRGPSKSYTSSCLLLASAPPWTPILLQLKPQILAALAWASPLWHAVSPSDLSAGPGAPKLFPAMRCGHLLVSLVSEQKRLLRPAFWAAHCRLPVPLHAPSPPDTLFSLWSSRMLPLPTITSFIFQLFTVSTPLQNRWVLYISREMT